MTRREKQVLGFLLSLVCLCQALGPAYALGEKGISTAQKPIISKEADASKTQQATTSEKVDPSKTPKPIISKEEDASKTQKASTPKETSAEKTQKSDTPKEASGKNIHESAQPKAANIVKAHEPNKPKKSSIDKVNESIKSIEASIAKAHKSIKSKETGIEKADKSSKSQEANILKAHKAKMPREASIEKAQESNKSKEIDIAKAKKHTHPKAAATTKIQETTASNKSIIKEKQTSQPKMKEAQKTVSMISEDAPKKPKDPLAPEDAYFQNIANQWVHVDKGAADTAAVLKGQVAVSSIPYTLGPGDVISISIPGIAIEEFDKDAQRPTNADSLKDMFDVVVRQGQNTTIPPFGTFTIAGMSLSQVTDMLQQMASYYMVKPHVYVTLKSMRPFTVYMAGEIHHPGAYQTSNIPDLNQEAFASINETKPGQTQRIFEAHISQLISLAGGILPTSDIEHVHVINEENGKETTVNLLAMIDGDSSQDVILSPGDTVTIPKVERGKYPSISVGASTLTPNRQVVRIIGLATHTGAMSEVTLDSRSMTLLNALSQVNVNNLANLRKVVILRPDPKEPGKVHKLLVNSYENDLALEPNDVIMLIHARPILVMNRMVSMVGQYLLGLGIWWK